MARGGLGREPGLAVRPSGAVGQVGDHPDELGAPVAVLAGELHELADLGEDGAALGRAGDGTELAALARRISSRRSTASSPRTTTGGLELRHLA